MYIFIRTVISVIIFSLGFGLGFWKSFKIASKIIDKKEKEKDKILSYYELCDDWIKLRERDIKLDKYFELRGYRHIAIYGIGNIGIHLLKELKKTGICVDYAIDANVNFYDYGLKVYSIDDKLPIVDVIVITPIFAYDSILGVLREKTKIPIVSLDDIIYELK